MFREAPGFRPGPRKQGFDKSRVDDVAGIVCLSNVMGCHSTRMFVYDVAGNICVRITWRATFALSLPQRGA